MSSTSGLLTRATIRSSKLSMATSAAIVLALLAIMARAPRPGSLLEDHATLQAEDERTGHYSVHAGGHFSKGHKQSHQGKTQFTESIDETQEHRPAPGEGVLKQPEAVNGVQGAATGQALNVANAGVGAVTGAAGIKRNSTAELAEQDFPPVHAECGKEFGGGPDVHQCPKTCGYAAEMDTSADPTKECHFLCVGKMECGLKGTQKTYTISDDKGMECRRCDVEGCLTCEAGKPGQDIEKCQTCMPGYYKVDIDGDGYADECRSWTIWIFLAIAGFAGVAIIAGIVWFLELRGRETTNEDGLKYALECRSRSKLRQPSSTVPSDNPEDMIGPRLLYPYNTNLCTTNVAGPGNMLFFRFQAATLIWACTLLAVWCGTVLFVDPALFNLGLRSAGTPAQVCYIVKTGRAMQLKYLWVKVSWLVFAYVFSFLGAIYYAINSQSLFQTLDNEHTTMADYVAICCSVPKMKGDQKVEECIKECIEKETGEKVVGVSVCWNFHDKVTQIKEALEEDVGSLEHAKATNGGRFGRGEPDRGQHEQAIQHGEGEEAGCMTRYLDAINNATLNKWHCHFHEHAEEKLEEDKIAETTEMLKGLECTEMAFAVFETEDSRDKALEAVRGRPIPLGDGEGFFLESETHEPESCCWEDFSVDEAQIAARLGKGVMMMTISLCIWTFMLYAPYAHYMGSFTYSNGDEPGEMSEGIFISLVVVAQIGLFVVASSASRAAGFCFEDDKQRTYILLYNTALIVNLILDMTLTAALAYKQMCGRGVRTADGRLLSSLENLQEILESYPMQKAIGNNLFKYCWPATFFVPFFAEPFAAQIGPYLVGTYLCRSNKKVTGENAEKALELSEAEQGRYADVMFNAILVCGIPFIAPGYMARTFVALIFSHVFIYNYDHWRVLRCCTRFHFASDTVNEFSQKIFAIPTAMLAAGVVFKTNQMLGFELYHSIALGGGPLKGFALWGAMAGAFFTQLTLHLLVLAYVIPMCGVPENKNAEEPYEECAKVTPCTWFSSNPVHCLRSKYIYKHNPPQTFYVIGKEHLQKKNKAIGAYFEAEELKTEGTLGL